MMTGRVSWQLEAIVNVEIQDAEGYFHTLRCTLDTGFDGDLALPSGVIEQLGLVPIDILNVTLANSARASMPKYNANVSWQERLSRSGSPSNQWRIGYRYGPVGKQHCNAASLGRR